MFWNFGNRWQVIDFIFFHVLYGSFVIEKMSRNILETFTSLYLVTSCNSPWRFCNTVSLTSSNKGGDTNISIKYGGFSCWLLFSSSGYSEEKLGTAELIAWYSGDSTKISSFVIKLNCYSQRNNRKLVLIDIIA